MRSFAITAAAAASVSCGPRREPGSLRAGFRRAAGMAERLKTPGFRSIASQPDQRGRLAFIICGVCSMPDVLLPIEALTGRGVACVMWKETFATQPHPA